MLIFPRFCWKYYQMPANKLGQSAAARQSWGKLNARTLTSLPACSHLQGEASCVPGRAGGPPCLPQPHHSPIETASQACGDAKLPALFF